MPYESAFAIRKLPIDQNGFTDIVGPSVLPIDCNVVVIFNDTGQDILLRSDPANANSEVTIHDGQQFEIGTAFSSSARGARFQRGSSNPVGALKAAVSGVSPLIESIF